MFLSSLHLRGPTSSSAQELLLASHSGITPGRLMDYMGCWWRELVRYMQGKCFTHCATILSSFKNHFVFTFPFLILIVNTMMSRASYICFSVLEITHLWHWGLLAATGNAIDRVRQGWWLALKSFSCRHYHSSPPWHDWKITFTDQKSKFVSMYSQCLLINAQLGNCKLSLILEHALSLLLLNFVPICGYSLASPPTPGVH